MVFKMKKFTFIIFASLLVTFSIGAYAISSEWVCTYGDSPYGDIEITYTNEDATNKAEIHAITPQKHPIIYPGGELVLQLNSENCFEFTLVVKDYGGNEVGRYSEKPYSPYPECEIPPGGSTEGIEFLTMIVFDAPGNPGTYTLDVYDPQNVLLTTGVIEILDPTTQVSSVSRTSWCTIDDSNYTIILSVPYPVVFEPDNPGEMSVIIKGSDTSAINEMFNQMSMSISPQYAAQISLNESGSPVCSDNECRQDYSVTSSTSVSAIAYVWHEETSISKTAINSKGITLLDLSKLKEIKSKLDELSSTALDYVDYYSSINDNENVMKWQDAYDKVSSISSQKSTLIPVLESREFKISDVVDLINIIEDSQQDIDETITSLSGA